MESYTFRSAARPTHVLLLIAVCVSAMAGEPTTSDEPAPSAIRWWKGNLHTHSLWSDGEHFPEMIMDWYKSHGYHFLALSDHNILADHERWIDLDEGANRRKAYAEYLQRFGPEWIEARTRNGQLEVRLKTLAEYAPLFNEPGRFLVIQGEEITDSVADKPVHVNATNLQQLIPPQGGNTVRECMQRNIDAVLAQRKRTGRPMFPHLNHPNLGWAVSPEDLAAVTGERFFEVYNSGSPGVKNEGDDTHPDTERMWDLVLTDRLRRGAEMMYGLAVDDAHTYGQIEPRRSNSNPGRGWVMVRAATLSPAALIEAMEAGNFYSTTGVVLEDVHFENGRLAIKIRAEAGIKYTTRFIGTRRNTSSIGQTLAEISGEQAEYVMTGDELYVRATVISTKPKQNPYRAGEVEVAWTQPVVPKP